MVPGSNENVAYPAPTAFRPHGREGIGVGRAGLAHRSSPTPAASTRWTRLTLTRAPGVHPVVWRPSPLSRHDGVPSVSRCTPPAWIRVGHPSARDACQPSLSSPPGESRPRSCPIDDFVAPFVFSFILALRTLLSASSARACAGARLCALSRLLVRRRDSRTQGGPLLAKRCQTAVALRGAVRPLRQGLVRHGVVANTPCTLRHGKLATRSEPREGSMPSQPVHPAPRVPTRQRLA